MYDFDILEKRCKKYHLKKYFLISTPFLIIIVAFVNYMIFFYNKPTIQSNKIEKQINQKIIKTPTSSSISKPLHNNTKKNNKYYYLQFFAAKETKIKYLYKKEEKLQKLGFDCYIYKGKSLLYLRCNSTKDYNKFLQSKELAKRYKLDFISKRESYSQKPYKYKKLKIAEKKKITIKEKPIIKAEDTFVLKSQKFNVSNLKKLFQERKSYNIALKIAQYYYKMQGYTHAIEWAKKANAIDKTDAQSWIIYATSLYTIGEKEKAKKILHIYLQFENSEQVNNILAKWGKK